MMLMEVDLRSGEKKVCVCVLIDIFHDGHLLCHHHSTAKPFHTIDTHSFVQLTPEKRRVQQGQTQQHYGRKYNAGNQVM